MNRTLLTLILCGLLQFAPAALARDTIEASPYANVLSDLLEAFHAEDSPCEGGAGGTAEACFHAHLVSASYLAERLTEIVESYEGVGLRSGGWRSANGVWTVALSFPNSSYGHLELYLAEGQDKLVKGMFRLVDPR